MNFFLGRMKDNNQVNNHHYNSGGNMKYFNGLNIGDYVFINHNSRIVALWKAKEVTSEGMNFDVVCNFSPEIRLRKFAASTLFIIDKVLCNFVFKQLNSKAFFKLSLLTNEENTILKNNDLSIENLQKYLDDENNYRKLDILKDKQLINKDSKNIQIYLENNEYKLYKTSFMGDELFEKFDNKNYLNGKESVRKKKLFNAIKENDQIKISDDYGLDRFYDLFVSDKIPKSKKNNKSNSNKSNSKNQSSMIKNGENRIVYGIPGCGKSFYVQSELLKGFNYVERTTFFPDYSNTDFIGSMRPIKRNNGIDYIISPGPFTIVLETALKNPNEKVALVIEELNRGNAAAIFGDIFQLLDRDENTGESEYKIVNNVICEYLKDKGFNYDKIFIPGNMFIFATMNTSDQNVFKLDTAFKRRWNFTRLVNDKNNCTNIFKVDGTVIENWISFVDSINKIVLQNKEELNGDRQLGYWFVKKGIGKEEFANKVLEYLYNDVLKYSDKSLIFSEKYSDKSFDDIYIDFIDNQNVFNDIIELK